MDYQFSRFEDSSLPEYDTALLGEGFTVFQRNILPSGTIHPVTKVHIPEDKNNCLNFCEKLKTFCLRFDRILKQRSSVFFYLSIQQFQYQTLVMYE
jgi:hypothetical protein